MSRFSLFVRLTLFFSFIVLLVTTTLSAVAFYPFGNKINQQIERNLGGIADRKAAEISNLLLFERTNLLFWRASLDRVADDLDKPISTELIKRKQAYQLPGDLYVFNAAGVLIASTQPDVLKTHLPKAWQTQQDYALVFKHEVPFINGSVIAHVTALNSPPPKMQGYWVMTHSWDDIAQLLAPKDNNFAFRKTTEATADLFTANGVETIAMGDDFSAKSLWIFDQHSYLGSISTPSTVGDFSFQIAAFMPEKLAHEPLLELTKNLLVAAALVCILLIALVSWLSRRLLTPIKKLTATLRTIEDANDLSIKIPVSGCDEVADLGNAFNRMTTRLGESFSHFIVVEKELGDLNLNLERQVIDRTAQLQDALQRLKSTQTYLLQSAKMVSLGQLLVGITDEINKTIGTIYADMPPLEQYIDDIKGTVEFAQHCMNEPDTQKLNAHLERINYTVVSEDLAKLLNSQKQAVEHISNIVLSLHNFSRPDPGKMKTTLLEQGLDSTLQILHHIYKNRIIIEKDYALNESVECYAGELNHVFMNILANAIQAIPDKGSIFITTARMNDQAFISIADTGTGMPDEVKNKIFDPFFTTKKPGEGTGLGLSMSYDIIEKHQGTLTVESEFNRGTRFIIVIPLRLTCT